jgi:Planctomycete cytochrome C
MHATVPIREAGRPVCGWTEVSFSLAPHQDSHEKYGPAILPGKPDKSPLVQRIEAKNAKERMPHRKRTKP